METKSKTNPLVGKGKANLSKSQRDPNHQFQSLALRFEISDDALLLTFTGVSMSGKEESGTQKIHPDGKERPVAEAHGIVEVSRWVGSHILESVAKKDGTVIGAGRYEVSSDGKQNSNSAVRLPLLAHTTYLGDTRPLVEAIIGYRRGLEAGISYGMHLSVVCSEDAPRMNPARAAVADRDTALGDYRVAQLAAACREWVKGDVSPDHAKPVRSDVPALLVSGKLDPNTNERWGDEAARYLNRATHVVIPNLSHSFSSVSECGADFIATFIAAASAQDVDFSCKDRVQLPPFARVAQ